MAPAGIAARARRSRARAAIPAAGAIAPAGAIAAAGPDFEAAGPDFEAAGPDFEAAGPNLSVVTMVSRSGYINKIETATCFFIGVRIVSREGFPGIPKNWQQGLEK